MSLSQRLQGVLSAFDLELQISDAVRTEPTVVQADLERARRHLSRQLENLSTYALALSTPAAREELYEVLAIWYMEARCEWAQLNLASNRLMWDGMESDKSIMIRAAVGSKLLEEVSLLLAPQDVDRLESNLLATLNDLQFPDYIS